MSDSTHRTSFFKQSGWLMIANIAGGALMWAVHFLNKFIPSGEYGSFGALLAVVMLLPTMPLQMLFAQQTAKALANHSEGQIASLIRRVWLGTTLFWVLVATVVLLLQSVILERWQMSNPTGLWITLGIVLVWLWAPLFWGVLQGQQNFLWLGWSLLSNGIGRLAVGAFAVLLLQGGAAGIMSGVLLGIALSVAIAVWQTRALWWMRSELFDWHGLLPQAVPLILGFLGFQILFSADTVLVKAYFSEQEVDFYVGAGTLSRALMWLVLPLAAVMFPRIVHSVAKSEKTNLMGMVLAATAGLAIVGALGLSLLGPWVVRIVYRPEFVSAVTPLLPWYAAAMVPLALANVLLNDLLARPASALAPALGIFTVALGYLFALTRFHGRLVTVLQVLGLFGCLLLVVCAWFTWRTKSLRPAT